MTATTVKKRQPKLTDAQKRYVYKAIKSRIEHLNELITYYNLIPPTTEASNLIHAAAALSKEELVHQQALLELFKL